VVYYVLLFSSFPACLFSFCVVLGYVNLWVFAPVKRLAERIVSKMPQTDQTCSTGPLHRPTSNTYKSYTVNLIS